MRKHCSGSQYCLPNLWRARLRRANGRDVKLPFLNLVNEFDASNRDARMIEALEPQRRPYALVNFSMILFNDVV